VTVVDAAAVVDVAFDVAEDVAFDVVVGVAGAADFPLEPQAPSSTAPIVKVRTGRTRTNTSVCSLDPRSTF
jgi:hypothetical protein